MRCKASSCPLFLFCASRPTSYSFIPGSRAPTHTVRLIFHGFSTDKETYHKHIARSFVEGSRILTINPTRSVSSVPPSVQSDSSTDTPSMTLMSSQQTQQTQQPRSFPRTFYRRQLPSTAISFSSPEGRDVFQSAMVNGGTRTFFPLIEQLQTQPEPAYCGLTTLVIVLNALAVDPRRSWKGPWRWYTESMLNCCVDLETVKETGITFGTFSCLAKCQGLNVTAKYGSNSTVDEFRQTVKEICTDTHDNPNQNPPTSFLVVSYTRKVIGQTGTGHFSPIGAYDEASDHVLVLDTARFKYGPHWVPLELLFEALLPLDPSTGKSRGYMVLSYDGAGESSSTSGGKDQLSQLPLSVLFGSKKSKDFLRREYKQYLMEFRDSEEGASKGDLDGTSSPIDFKSVVSFWTKNSTDNSHVWELVEPQLQPVVSSDIEMVNNLRLLLKQLIAIEQSKDTSCIDALLVSKQSADSSSNGECCTPSTCTSNGRVLDISPAEALYIIYLASLTLEQRTEIVSNATLEKEEVEIQNAVREQLLAESALISYAIDECDAEI